MLKSDGTAAACGSNDLGACSVPALSEGVVYTQVAAGDNYTVLLKSDGTAVACGDNMDGQCDIPALPGGVTYVQLVSAPFHTVLIRSDGAAVACGYYRCGCRTIPALTDGVTYTHVAAIGICHTVLLTSDGNAVACGQNHRGQCSIPALPPGVAYVHRGAQILLFLFYCNSHAAFCRLSGAEICRFWVDASDTLINVQKEFKGRMMTDYGKYRVVLPSGELLSVVCAQAPSTIIGPFLIRKRVRRN